MSRLVFTGANLIDGEAAAQPGMTVVVEGERIREVVPDARYAPRPGDRALALAGRSLMPGLFQAHFHSCFSDWGPASAPQLGLEKSPPLMTLYARQNVETALACGFTSLVCSSVPYNIDYQLKQAMLLGLFEGPRMWAGSRELMTPGDQPDAMNRFYYMEVGNQGMVRHASGVDEMQRATREELGRGADVIKIAASHGHGVGPAYEYESVTREELRSVASTARAKGKLSRAHAASKSAILNCAAVGIDIIDHADRVDAECIDAILASGSSVAPTPLFTHRFLTLMSQMQAAGEDLRVHAAFVESEDETRERIDGTRADFENQCRMLPEMDRAGIPIVVGDDFGTALMPHGSYVDELEFYVKQVGMAPLDVVRWATKNGAAAVGMGGELGTVSVGKRADLLVVDGDPTSDITCLRPEQLHAILIDGEFRKEELAPQRTREENSA